MDAPGRLLGTTTDPNYQANKYAQMGQIIGLAMQAFRQRQEKRKSRELAEIELFLNQAGKNPDLATTWGPKLKAYEGTLPGISAIVDSLANRQQRAADIEAGGAAFMDRTQAIEDGLKRAGEAVLGMPDTEMIAGIPVPSLSKMAGQQFLASQSPEQAPMLAVAQMPVRQRYAAQAWANQNKVPFPELPVGYRPDPTRMPADVQALMAASATNDPSAVKDGVLQLIGLAPRPGVMGEKTHSTDEDIRLAEEKHENSRELQGGRFAESEQGRRAREAEEARRHANRLSEISARAAGGGKKKGGGLAGELVAVAETGVKDYDERFKLTMRGESVGEDGGAVPTKKAFVKKNGTRPKALPPAYARRIEAKLDQWVKSGAVPKDLCDEVGVQVVGEYQALTARGKTPEQALLEALKE